MQKNPVQAMQGAMQGDLFYLHLVEDLVGEGRGGSGGVGEESEKGRPNEGMLMNGEDGEDEAGANAVTEVRRSFFFHRYNATAESIFFKDLQRGLPFHY